jgi:hypothetical protein
MYRLDIGTSGIVYKPGSDAFAPGFFLQSISADSVRRFDSHSLHLKRN